MIHSHNKCFCAAILLLLPLFSFCQTRDSVSGDSLEVILITAYEQKRALRHIPAAVNFISPRAFERYNPSSVLMAINSAPGVRMEERSPGSYRLNIRGSALRSPFGVRNVKIYYNDLPVTDPGGNSFFNQFSPANIHSIEIIKGPGSSVYGAGTGGVMLVRSPNDRPLSRVLAEYSTGSFQMHQLRGEITNHGEFFQSQAGFQIQKSNGYREHSKMERKVLSWNGRFRINENSLNASFLVGELFYETPGALTQDEYINNPSGARPGTAFSPGAIQSKASIRQTGFLAGASWEQNIFRNFRNKTSLYGMFTQLNNPAIRNYGKTSEPHTGLRSVFYFEDSISKGSFQWISGGEWQVGFPGFETFKNNQGNADTLLWFDEVRNRQNFMFTQLQFSIHSFSIMAGASINFYKTSIQRFSPAPSPLTNTTFRNEIAPRISLSYRLANSLLYTGISKGFSPPSISELNPTGSAINTGLKPEYGFNYDLGIRTQLKWMSLDINAFQYQLNNTIVLRRDSAGGDYYINSGKTSQRGVETAFTLPLFRDNQRILKSHFYISHTWHVFRYREFMQLENDYSGNKMPGTAPHTVSAGLDINFLKGFSSYLHYFFSDRIPLNDANAAYARAYHLFGIKLGYQKNIFKNQFMLSAGIENLLNEKYSLGNDINGFGGRYYNAAAGRNYFLSLKWEINLQK